MQSADESLDKVITKFEDLKIYYLTLFCHLIVAVICVIVLKEQHPIILFWILSSILLYLIYENENKVYKIMASGSVIYVLKNLITLATDVNSRKMKRIKYGIWELPFWCIISYYIFLL